MLDDEPGALMMDGGVDDRFQRRQLIAVRQYRRQRVSIDHPFTVVPGSAPRSAVPAGRQALQLAHNGVGIEGWNAGLGKHRRDGRLAHADRPGERQRDHGLSLCQSSASRSRGASWPKNSLKLVAACSTSMPRPSTVCRPRAGRHDQGGFKGL